MADIEKENINSNLIPPGWSSRKHTTPSKLRVTKNVFNSPSSSRSLKKFTPLTSSKKRLRHVHVSSTPQSNMKSSFGLDLTDLFKKFNVCDIVETAVQLEVYGNAKDLNYKKHLKRAKPKSRVILSGYTKEYVEAETKRLANGYREYVSKSDAFVLKAIENFKNFKKFHVHLDKKLSDLNDKNMELTTEHENLSQTLSIVKKEICSLKKQIELKDYELEEKIKQIRASKIKEEELLTQFGELNLASTKLKKEMKDKIDNINNEHSLHMLELQAEIKSKEKEKFSLKDQLNEINKQYQLSTELVREKEQENQNLILKMDKLTSEKEYVEKQNSSLENKLSQRDTHLEKTLETFQQNQTFSQNRIQDAINQKEDIERKLCQLKETFDMSQIEWENKSALNQEELQKSESKLADLESNYNLLNDSFSEKYTKLDIKFKKLSGSYDSEKQSWLKEKKSITKVSLSYEDQNKMLKEELSALQSELVAMKDTYESEKRNTELQQLYEVNKEKEILKQKVVDFEQLKINLLEISDRLFKAEQEKRELRNEIHTLKGTVRVIARIKPPKSFLVNQTSSIDESKLEDEEDEEERLKRECADIVNKLDKSITSIAPSDFTNIDIGVDEKTIDLNLMTEAVSGMSSKKHNFKFNHVFGPKSSQIEVFDEVATFVQSALDGYNVCLFSYGQTGSGKTYTMTGDHFSPTNSGIIPRATSRIMQHKEKLEEVGWKFSLEAMFVEIYNENVIDLLSKTRKPLEVRDSKARIIVSGATTSRIHKENDVHHLIVKAENNRRVEKTNMNQRSSRSHSVFTIFITGVHDGRKAKLSGSLSLCDLAGSERIKRSQVQGERFKETVHINKSLSALSDVFCSIKARSKHIPFRNSKLTTLLRPCFAGQGKVLMIVNLSVEDEDLQESLCSLRFAQHVNHTEVGRAKKNVEQLSQKKTS